MSGRLSENSCSHLPTYTLLKSGVKAKYLFEFHFFLFLYYQEIFILFQHSVANISDTFVLEMSFGRNSDIDVFIFIFILFNFILFYRGMKNIKNDTFHLRRLQLICKYILSNHLSCFQITIKQHGFCKN